MLLAPPPPPLRCARRRPPPLWERGKKPRRSSPPPPHSPRPTPPAPRTGGGAPRAPTSRPRASIRAGVAKPVSFLLEPVEGGGGRGRYSIIGPDPDVVWRARGGTAEINRTARQERDAFVPCGEPPLPALRTFIKESRFVL